ncbi:MAG: GntR family transcriptional regulator [Lactobacillus sp.]|jgi:DNA-binding GntR family transcriptional regulator|uniref:GntR family transcriptional regulator n=1 Tax=Lacticaseibacillus suilingensis TaxID=2799577 RepID=A0ABW4BH39_9LACO|nr:GntR family transcriptional regulator [Lacticaseibacillus suilingensis]MCI1894205.1 GntR family transcriptional regulator [Lactobacillus sp.]MCI1917131.1 GntR family transcriptional regulator [Lactobacillus sp.]MCI1941571.1 GntR family transcriptional regulator [Lactobacillus sp.]MCI1972117.1 GntR family transcriptional regulator [Lactobacillus sp.]MCI2017510.1 GntR family transcriptional regulator [Lactobacillus sp.]
MQPKYQLIKQEIVKAIEDGTFKPGMRIYSEGELRTKYGVSNTTAVRALNELVSEGYLVRRQGDGTFVRRNLNHQKAWFSEFSPYKLDATGQRVRMNEHSVTTVDENVSNATISTLLGDPTESQQLICVHQVAYANDVAWKFQDRYLLGTYLDHAAIERLKTGSSLSREMRLDRNLADYPTQTLVNVQARTELPGLEKEIAALGQEANYADAPAVFHLTKTFYGPAHQTLVYLISDNHPGYYHIEVLTD